MTLEIIAVRYVILLLFFFGGPIALYAQDTISVSLQQAIDLGIKGNPDVAIAGLQESSAEYAVRENAGNFLPKLSLNGSYTRNIDRPVIFLPETFGQGGVTKIGSNNNFVGYLSLSVPLYSRYNTASRLSAQRNFLLQKEANDGVQQAVITNIRKTYTSTLVLGAVLNVRKKTVANALLNYHNAKEKMTSGAATEFDVATAEVKVAASRNNLLEAKSQLIPVQDNLKVLLHLPMETYLVLTDSLVPVADVLAMTETKELLGGNNNFRQQQIKTEIAHEQTKTIRASYFPVVSGTGTYQYQSQQNDFNFSTYRWVLSSAIGVSLQVPLFNGTVTKNRVQQAILSEHVARIRRDYTSLSNEAQYNQLLSTMQYARERISIQLDNIALADRALELVKERYRYGKATFLEVSNAELDFETARLTYFQAVGDYNNTYFDWKLLTGQLF